MKKYVLLFGAFLMTMTSNAQTTAEAFHQPYPLGEKVATGGHFSGDVWLSRVSESKQLDFPITNVTFSPGCINSWHYHTGGQILVATAGVGYYQEQGKPARRLYPGDIVEIAPQVVHWHGAAPDAWFAHLAAMPNVKSNQTVWLDPVSPEAYAEATSGHAPELSELAPRESHIVQVALFTGRGDLAALSQALGQALDSGMTINELKEVLVHAYAYAGFPRSLRGIQTLMTLLEERRAQGIQDIVGREASPVASGEERYVRGRKTLELLTGVSSSEPAPYAVFAPIADLFLKEHLFADLFDRDLLSYRDRELATVGILAALGGVEPMLRSHLGICRRLGLSQSQLLQVASLVSYRLGEQAASPLARILTGE